MFEQVDAVSQDHTTPWGAYGRRLLSDQQLWSPRNGSQDDGAHPPIYPTKAASSNDMQSWHPQKRKVYELVTRHFLACLSAAAQAHQTTINIEIAGEGFHAKVFLVRYLSSLVTIVESVH